VVDNVLNEEGESVPPKTDMEELRKLLRKTVARIFWKNLAPPPQPKQGGEGEEERKKQPEDRSWLVDQRQAKVVGVKLPADLRADARSEIDELVTLQGKKAEWDACTNFLIESGRVNEHGFPRMAPFLFKIQKVVTQAIKALPGFPCDASALIQRLTAELKLVKAELGSAYTRRVLESQVLREDGGGEVKNVLVAVDMVAATWQALKVVLGPEHSGTLTTWSDFFRRVVPIDTRGGDAGINGGRTTVIPEVIYSSKWLRTFLMGDLPVLAATWRLETARYLVWLLREEQVGMLGAYCLENDEFVVKCKIDDAVRLAALCAQYPLAHMFRMRSYEMRRIQDLSARVYQDNGQRLFLGESAEQICKLLKTESVASS